MGLQCRRSCYSCQRWRWHILFWHERVHRGAAFASLTDLASEVTQHGGVAGAVHLHFGGFPRCRVAALSAFPPVLLRWWRAFSASRVSSGHLGSTCTAHSSSATCVDSTRQRGRTVGNERLVDVADDALHIGNGVGTALLPCTCRTMQRRWRLSLISRAMSPTVTHLLFGGLPRCRAAAPSAPPLSPLRSWLKRACWHRTF